MPTGYAETYRRSIERPEELWAEAAEAIDWERRWDPVWPKTRSGKILRGAMRKIADDQDLLVPAAIDDPAVLGEDRPGPRESRLHPKRNPP
jgi:Acetyl-coenzyme A synthetase N-terminus